MASPQVENGYLKIANELAEALARINLNGESNKVLWVVLRKTYGFNKKEDWIPLSQFCDATGLRRAHVCRSINRLVDSKIVSRKRFNGKNMFSFNKNWEQWGSPETGTSRNRQSGSPETGNKVVPKWGHSKDNIQKTSKRHMKWKEYNENKHFEEPTMNVDGEWEKEVEGATNHTHHLITLFRLINPTIERMRFWKSTHADCRTLFEVHDESWWNDFMPKYANYIKTDPYATKAITPREMVDKIGKIEATINAKIKQQKQPITSKGRGIA